MVFVRNLGEAMEDGVYTAKNVQPIILYSSDYRKEIKYIVKSYSSMMSSFVLMCYPFADTEEEEIKGCVNLYHDDERAIDEMLISAIENNCIHLDFYFEKNV